MTIEHRTIRGIEIRATDTDGKPGVTLQAIRPGVVDDYGSLWNPRCFDEALAERMPVLCWAHDWSDPLGPAVGYEPGEDGPQVRFVFSDFDAVPQARRAHAQVSDGTIRDCSVGFSNVTRRDPNDDEIRAYPGVREVIERADLDEISLVLRGAVPGAKVLAVRTAAGTGVVDQDLVLDLARKVTAGDLTEAEAKAAIALAAAGTEPPATPPVGDTIDAELADIADDVPGDPLEGF